MVSFKFCFKFLTILICLIFFDCNITAKECLCKCCKKGTDCVFLGDCPNLVDKLKILKSSKSRNALIRKHFCRQGNDDKIFVCCPADCGMGTLPPRILGGNKTKHGELPWMAAIAYTDVNATQVPLYDCGGSVISNRYVLTAAHCVTGLEGKVISHLNLGDWDLVSVPDCIRTIDKCHKVKPHLVAGIEKVVLHPGYKEANEYDNDIALLRLNVSIDFNSQDHAIIKPICLPPKDGIKSDEALAAGWGMSDGANSIMTFKDKLQKVKLNFTDNTKCRESYAKVFNENKQLCLGDDPTKGVCRGDSGSPIMVTAREGTRYYAAGIVSFGAVCGLNKPDVVTNVANYIDWIEDNMYY